MTNDPIAAFKLGQAAHIEALLRGSVYMNSLGFFASLDAADARADSHEGLGFSRFAKGAQLAIEVDGVFQPTGTLTGPLTIVDPDLRDSNMYCLHVRRESDLDQPFMLNALPFGDAALMFSDFNEFTSRLERAARTVGQRIFFDVVEYVDPDTYVGPMGPFRKFHRHSGQKELRIVATPGIGKPLILELGSLADIAMIVPVDKNLLLTRRDREHGEPTVRLSSRAESE